MSSSTPLPQDEIAKRGVGPVAFLTLGVGSDLWDVGGSLGLTLHQARGGNGHMGRPRGAGGVPPVFTSKGSPLHGPLALVPAATSEATEPRISREVRLGSRGVGKCSPEEEKARAVIPRGRHFVESDLCPKAAQGSFPRQDARPPLPERLIPQAGNGEGLGDYSDLSLLVCVMRLTVVPAVAGHRTRPTASEFTAAEGRGDPPPLGQIVLGEGRAVGPSKAFAPSEAPPKEPVGPQHGATTEDAGVREEETQTSPLLLCRPEEQTVWLTPAGRLEPGGQEGPWPERRAGWWQGSSPMGPCGHARRNRVVAWPQWASTGELCKGR